MGREKSLHASFTRNIRSAENGHADPKMHGFEEMMSRKLRKLVPNSKLPGSPNIFGRSTKTQADLNIKVHRRNWLFCCSQPPAGIHILWTLADCSIASKRVTRSHSKQSGIVHRLFAIKRRGKILWLKHLQKWRNHVYIWHMIDCETARSTLGSSHPIPTNPNHPSFH